MQGRRCVLIGSSKYETLPTVKRITSIEVLPDYRLYLRFEDGVTGTVDLSAEVGRGLFQSLKDPSRFSAVATGHSGRSLFWPDGTDLCADALYLEVTGGTAETLFSRPDAVETNA